jgi:hypothetical protein
MRFFLRRIAVLYSQIINFYYWKSVSVRLWKQKPCHYNSRHLSGAKDNKYMVLSR